MTDKLVAVDLFAGAGGLSTGLAKAILDTHAETIARETGLEADQITLDNDRVHWWIGENVELHAVNHWEHAIETHEQNHPWAEHYHAKIEELHPPDVVEPGDVDLLVGGPSCTHYSRARGGKPVSEQKRASGWHVLHWVELLQPEHLVLENVPEFRDWGPIVDGQPTRDGSIFRRWVGMLEALGYSVLYDDVDEAYGSVLNAADFGEAQSRTRLFILASQSIRPTAPESTHSDADSDKPDRRTAADIIDWSDLGSSLWTRDLENPRVQPLAKSTMSRIAEGIRRHCDDRLAALADALEQIGKDELRELRENVVPAEHAATVADAIDHPFLVRVPSGRTALTTPEAFCLRQQSGGVPAPTNGPLPTVAKKGAIGMATAQTRSLVMPRNGPRRGIHSNPLYDPADRPLHTVTAKNTDGYLVSPSILHYSHGGSLRDIDDPMPTIATEKGGAFALSNPIVAPFLDEHYGKGRPQPIDSPLPTVTKKERFALCVPEVFPYGLDVRYRMLEPHELKQAQGFPESYELAGGTKKSVTAQIGNAVPVNLARALCRHLLVDETPSLSQFGGGVTADPATNVPAYSEVIESDD
ncbi:DNA cytosine methyltransferase [Natronorubrum daqingense]|uniref:DNA (cytosine-5-)-methyltransferase n=1 Tax=Natronorubrum daqingense TaxID=588898 RepID=A0A1N7G5A8_9EURY|nr:DNA cytosine methyltransferase [Natronorubrum daqingense]APX98729.1 DNA methyltransferase [Natronorubrum daqingense]SIS07606.1 DNA (cytosine-5)-methyltransferase 1 [Natronorubrum daqingense]